MPLPSSTASNWIAQYYYTKTELNAGQLDNLYFGEDEFLNTSAGAGDAGKPIKLNASGQVDATMLAGGSVATHAALTAAHGATGAVVGTTNIQTLTNKTLTTPTISATGFANANHAHTGSTSGGQLDHGSALTGLTDDDHTQYALLAGRGGGQNLYGGTASGDDLLLESTSNATKGTVALNPNGGNVSIGTNNGTSKLYIYGTQNSASAGPHVHVVTTEDNYPVLHVLGQAHDNVAISWDTYFDSGGFKASDPTGCQWYKAGDNFKLRIFNSATPGSAPSWTDAITQSLTSGTTTIASLAATAATVGGADVVTLSASQTLTNKTLTTPVISGTGFTNAQHAHTGASSGGKLDHGAALNGLTDDDHTQYALLNGRSGGQTLYGGTAANDDITIHGTSNATRTTSYVSLQPSGGAVVVGGSTTDHRFEVQDQGSSNYRMTMNLNASGVNYLNSYSTAPGVTTGAPLALFGSRVIINAGRFNIDTTHTPSSASDTGTTGDIAWDSNYIYVAVGSNSWKRAALSTW